MKGYTNVYFNKYDEYIVRDQYMWLTENCTGKFYTGYAWDRWPNRVVEFEKEEDAILFTLKWVK